MDYWDGLIHTDSNNMYRCTGTDTGGEVGGAGELRIECDREGGIIVEARRSVDGATRRHGASKCRHRRHQVAGQPSSGLVMRKHQYLSLCFTSSYGLTRT